MTEHALMERPPEMADEMSLVQRGQSGALALAMLTEQDFESRLKMLKLARSRVERIQKELMTEGEDYGVIPGTKKPTLLKPGAEKLCQVYRLVPDFIEQWIEGDGETTPHLRVRVKCLLHLGSLDGPVVGQGVGAANSWEKKYRYRASGRTCPSCGVEGSIRRSRYEDRETHEKGWYCHDKAGGCGMQFRSGDPEIVQQEGGQVDNPDPYDPENTLLKMAAKRSQTDAVLRTTATSGLFEQEDVTTGEPPAEDSRPQTGRVQPPKRRSQTKTPDLPPGSVLVTHPIVFADLKLDDGAVRRLYTVRFSDQRVAGTFEKPIADFAEAAHQAKRPVWPVLEAGKKDGGAMKLIEFEDHATTGEAAAQ